MLTAVRNIAGHVEGCPTVECAQSTRASSTPHSPPPAKMASASSGSAGGTSRELVTHHLACPEAANLQAAVTTCCTAHRRDLRDADTRLHHLSCVHGLMYNRSNFPLLAAVEPLRQVGDTVAEGKWLTLPACRAAPSAAVASRSLRRSASVVPQPRNSLGQSRGRLPLLA